jgi:DNA-binding MarR family transcriptional regulator
MTIPDPPDHIGWLLVNAGQLWRDRFVVAMQQSGYQDFTLSRANLLGTVDRVHGTKMVDLAARLGMTKQAVGQIVDDLEAAGYLARIADPADGRAKRAVYTDKGLALLKTADRVKGEIESALARAMSQRDMDRLSVLLRRAIDNLARE